jgi:hypothetical protein
MLGVRFGEQTFGDLFLDPRHPHRPAGLDCGVAVLRRPVRHHVLDQARLLAHLACGGAAGPDGELTNFGKVAAA